MNISSANGRYDKSYIVVNRDENLSLLFGKITPTHIARNTGEELQANGCMELVMSTDSVLMFKQLPYDGRPRVIMQATAAQTEVCLCVFDSDGDTTYEVTIQHQGEEQPDGVDLRSEIGEGVELFYASLQFWKNKRY